MHSWINYVLLFLRCQFSFKLLQKKKESTFFFFCCKSNSSATFLLSSCSLHYCTLGFIAVIHALSTLAKEVVIYVIIFYHWCLHRETCRSVKRDGAQWKWQEQGLRARMNKCVNVQMHRWGFRCQISRTVSLSEEIHSQHLLWKMGATDLISDNNR